MSKKRGGVTITRFIPRTWQLPLALGVFAVMLWALSTAKTEVEWRYSTGMYPHISRALRWLTGWLPFSLGDLLYLFISGLLVVKSFRFLKKLFKRKLTKSYLLTGGRQLLVFLLSAYIIFMASWGLNYARVGIAGQLQLEVKRYSTADLDTVMNILKERLNKLGDSQTGRQALRKRPFLFSEGTKTYRKENVPYPFMAMTNASVKRSMFGSIGNYLGFQGYYNPFTSEGQVNTTVPVFMRPNIVCHEMAHQAGYAKENEANFVGYLAGKFSPNPCFRYSVYFDMLLYGLVEMQVRDSARMPVFMKNLHPQVKADIREWQDFRRKHKNPIEGIVMWFYGQYLKANSMPSGLNTYNEVVAWLIAYYKKYGAWII